MNRFIPCLPALAGYVEVELDGERVYRSVETDEIFDPRSLPPTAEDRLEAVEAAILALMNSEVTDNV